VEDFQLLNAEVKRVLMIVCHVWRQLQKLANAKGKFTFDATKSCSSRAGKYNGKTPMYSDDEQTAIKTDSVFRTFVSSDADFKSITQDKQVREKKNTQHESVGKSSSICNVELFLIYDFCTY
jgi:hypothetical protein